MLSIIKVLEIVSRSVLRHCIRHFVSSKGLFETDMFHFENLFLLMCVVFIIKKEWAETNFKPMGQENFEK